MAPRSKSVLQARKAKPAVKKSSGKVGARSQGMKQFFRSSKVSVASIQSSRAAAGFAMPGAQAVLQAKMQKGDAHDQLHSEGKARKVQGKEKEEGAMQAKGPASVMSRMNVSAGKPVPQGGGKPLPPSMKKGMEKSFGTSLDTVRVHDGSAARDFVKDRNALAVTYGQDIFLGEGEYRNSDAEFQHVLAHETAHTLQQRNFSAPGKIDNADQYQHFERDADRAADQYANQQTATVQSGAQPGLQFAGNTDEAELAPMREQMVDALGPMGAAFGAKIKTRGDYESTAQRLVSLFTEMISSKLLEFWVDDSDEAFVLSLLRTMGKIPRFGGGNYLDDILVRLRHKMIYMDYFVTESPRSTFLDQLFEEMEGGHKPELYGIIDRYSTAFKGYRGRGGVSLFGSVGSAAMPADIKARISKLNHAFSGRSTIPMTKDEIAKANLLYTTIRIRSGGLMDMPNVKVQPAGGQHFAPAIPAVGAAIIVLVLLVVSILVYLILREIIKALIELFEGIAERMRSEPIPVPITTTPPRAIPRTRVDPIPIPIPTTRVPPCLLAPTGYHLGGDPRHNACAESVPNMYPGSDALLTRTVPPAAKNYDALGPGSVLWEVKTDNYSSFTPFLKQIVLNRHVAEATYDFALAASCGHPFAFGVTDPEHQSALQARLPMIPVRLLSC